MTTVSSLASLLTRAAILWPNAISVEDSGGVWTWEELRCAAGKVSAHFRDAYGSGEVLAIDVPDSRMSLAAMWGCWLSGNTVLM